MRWEGDRMELSSEVESIPVFWMGISGRMERDQRIVNVLEGFRCEDS